MQTLTDLIEATGLEVHEHLDRELTIPILNSLQVQGDVIVIPRRAGKGKNTIAVPRSGVPVVRGEAGGNTHMLLADGNVTWRTLTETRGLTLGVVTVERDAVAFLLHPEHGGMGLAPGCYEIRRQREQAEEIRIVSD